MGSPLKDTESRMALGIIPFLIPCLSNRQENENSTGPHARTLFKPSASKLATSQDGLRSGRSESHVSTYVASWPTQSCSSLSRKHAGEKKGSQTPGRNALPAYPIWGMTLISCTIMGQPGKPEPPNGQTACSGLDLGSEMS